MQGLKRILTPLERARWDNLNEYVARAVAVQDYNLMMGNLDDPEEDMNEEEE